MAEVTIQTIITQLDSPVLQEIRSASGVEKELGRLKKTLIDIKGVLPHAENLQLSNNDVRSWLRRIRDAAYDVEDIIDDFATDVLREKQVVQGNIFKSVRHFFSPTNPRLLRIKVAHRIQEMRDNLKGNYNDHQLIGLEKGFQEDHNFISMGRETHSYIPEENVFGRGEEKEKIIKLLLDSSGRDSLSVIPIQGMGGIGKTTLAKLIYNDFRVIDSFDIMMWVYVSEVFDLQKILERILSFGRGKELPRLGIVEQMSRTREQLTEKKYILVLDDIWNEELDKWQRLKSLLVVGAPGSKIIVTTRSERIGMMMGTTAVHRVSRLSEVDCWNLFKARAFKEGEEGTDPELVEIGREIAIKCSGVPLAAKTLGRLCYLAKMKKLELVRDCDIWELPEEENGILGSLRISYNHLSLHLKRCFAYCSIFPKDYGIEKDVLIKLWIAQGFIPSSGENRLPEDIGNEYVEVLMCRSFFQEPEVDDCNNLFRFKMHDLIHDLAQSVAGKECFVICKDNETDFPRGVRHLFFNIKRPSSLIETPGIIPKPSDIRTLMFESQIGFSIIRTIFSNLKFLRVLKFRNDDIKYLPDSIDELKHLRYLQIEGEQIRNLPESFSNLQNLRVLKLKCKRLDNLPNRIQNMISLRHIDIGTAKRGYMLFPDDISLSHMPWGLEELKSLQTLSRFVVGKDKVGCDLNGLNGLTNLGGSLEIWNLQNVKSAMESKETNLKTKRKLEILRLFWREPYESHITREAVGFEVLENLEPPSTLTKLQIVGYVGTRFPRWMMKLSNVVEIELSICKKCKRLPRFSHLPSLKFLRLGRMNGLQCIEDRPEQNHKEWFPSLTQLEILKCHNLESWFPTEAQPQQEQQQMLSLLFSFPSLVGLKIYDCPRLRNMPLLPSIIKSLVLKRSNGELLHSLIPSPNSCLASLAVLVIKECEGLESLPSSWRPQLTSLHHLSIVSASRKPINIFLP